jgi:uncharacterized protein
MNTVIEKTDFLSYKIIKQLRNKDRFIKSNVKGILYLFDSHTNIIYQTTGKLRVLLNLTNKRLTDNFVENLNWDEAKKNYETIMGIVGRKPKYFSIRELAAFQPTNSINLNINSTCNLSCVYCFTDKTKKINSTIALFYKLIDNYVYQYSQNIKYPVICFKMTGEPFMDIDMLEKLIAYTKKIEQNTDKRFIYFYLTNGTILNDRIINILKKPLGENRKIDISLDGPREIHDSYRTFKEGQGSYDIIMDNVQRFKNEGFDIGFAGVVAKLYPYPAKILKHYIELGASTANIKPIRAGSALSFDNDTVVELMKGYNEYFGLIKKWIVEENLQKLKIIKDDFGMRALKTLVTKIPVLQRCGWSTHNFSVNEVGDFYPCDSMMGIDEFKIGNVTSGFDIGKFKIDLTTIRRGKCKICWARYICGGTCYFDSYKTKGSILETDDVECKIKKHLLKKSLQIMYFTIEKKGSINILKGLFK